MTNKEYINDFIKEQDDFNDIISEDNNYICTDIFYRDEIIQFLEEEEFDFDGDGETDILVYCDDTEEMITITFYEGNRSKEYKKEIEWLTDFLKNEFGI